MTKTFNVICIKWGTYYGAEDVNKLCAAIKRNTSYDVNFYCFTERSEGLNEDIISRPLPVLNVAPELVSAITERLRGCATTIWQVYADNGCFSLISTR